MEWGVLLSAGALAVGGVVWMVRLEGRVNNHAILFEERKDRDVERYNQLLREIGSLRSLVEVALKAPRNDQHDGGH